MKDINVLYKLELYIYNYIRIIYIYHSSDVRQENRKKKQTLVKYKFMQFYR